MADRKKDWELYPASIYDAYRKVMNLARDMNTYIQAPEIVFIGPVGHGKASVIESFVGHFLFDPKGWTTKRPIHIKLLSNPDSAQPRVTIKRDYSSKTFGSDVRVELKDLPSELSKRNTHSQVPLVVEYEFKDCWNLTIIDTPDLYIGVTDLPKGVNAEDVQNEVLEQVRPPHRLVVCVEEVCDWGKNLMIEFAKQADPKLDRTVFVHTKLLAHIKNYTETQPLNQFFSSTVQGCSDKAFFVELIDSSDSKSASEFSVPVKFRERLGDLTSQTIEQLEQLKFDRRYEVYISAHSVRKHLLDATWKIYQDNIPTVQNRLRALKTNSEQGLAQLQGRLNGMDIYKLRSAASNFVMNFLQSIEKLIVGTLDGNPAQNGQTLAEEKLGAGEWYDINGQQIDLSTKDWNIPCADTRVYGGQQFERLLAEFKAVADHIEMVDIPLDDVATSAGPQKLNNVSAVAWSASDLARRASMKAFMPLIDQLIKRSILIMQRLPDIAVKMMANTKSKQRSQAVGPSRSTALMGRVGASQQQEFDIGVDEFPFFSHHVKDLYDDFIGIVAEECRDKCMDEFYCTRLIYWENTKIPSNPKQKDSSLVGMTPNETKDTVQALAANIFKSVKERITRNILLKCHNYFLAPMQSPLWGEIQGKVSVLPNQTLEELFEVTQTTARLKDEEKTLQFILEKFNQQEAAFQNASHAFSHPVR